MPKRFHNKPCRMLVIYNCWSTLLLSVLVPILYEIVMSCHVINSKRLLLDWENLTDCVRLICLCLYKLNNNVQIKPYYKYLPNYLLCSNNYLFVTSNHTWLYLIITIRALAHSLVMIIVHTTMIYVREQLNIE